MAKLPMEAPSSKLMVNPDASCRKLQPGPFGSSSWVLLLLLDAVDDVSRSLSLLSWRKEDNALALNVGVGVSFHRLSFRIIPFLFSEGAILSPIEGEPAALLVSWSNNGSSHKGPCAWKDTLILIEFCCMDYDSLDLGRL